MSLARRKPAEGLSQTYCGFRDDGSTFKSTESVDNACTRAMRYLVSEIRSKNLRPNEVVRAISLQPEFVQRMFRPAILGQWFTFDSYWQWPLCWTSTSAESTLKHRGAGVPIEPGDHASWEGRRQLAERARGELSATPAEVSAAALDLLSGWEALD